MFGCLYFGAGVFFGNLVTSGPHNNVKQRSGWHRSQSLMGEEDGTEGIRTCHPKFATLT